MASPFLIRTAVPADARVLADLARRTFLEAFGPLYDPADMAAFLEGAYGEARQRAELEDPRWVTLLAERDGEPLGFAQLILGREAPDGPCPGPVELNRIYLLRAAQGAGLGDALMAAVVAAAREGGGRNLWLGVWEHNAKAQAFYRRWGFVRTGEHVFRIGRQVDTDHILVRSLQEAP